MENAVIVLPQEVEQIAQNVSAEKRNEVQIVLNQVFDGVSKMRKQLDTVEVSDENDKVNMRLANTIRLGVRVIRLEAEKTFDAKRDEVQAKMLSYKTEDSLWLKAKQTMQILTKEIEEAARWKEETAKRFEAEQKELKTQQRINKVSVFNPEIGRNEFENMSDSVFDSFLNGLKSDFEAKKEAERLAEIQRIEEEKKQNTFQERRVLIAQFTPFINDSHRFDKETSEQDFSKIIKSLEGAKSKFEAEQKKREEEAKAEAEKLRKEAEEKEKSRLAELAKIEAERKKEAEEKAKLLAKIEAERKAKAEAEAKEQAELKAKKEAEKKAKSAPDKQKLNDFAKMLDEIKLPELTSEQAIAISSQTKILLGKVSTFIRDKANDL